MRYLCLVYIEEGAFDSVSPREGDILTNESLEYDDELRRGPLHRLRSAAAGPDRHDVRVRNGKLSTTDGPFAETKEQLGGFILIEARDLNEAIRVAAQHPHGEASGSIEVRPIMELERRSVDAVERRRATGRRRARRSTRSTAPSRAASSRR